MLEIGLYILCYSSLTAVVRGITFIHQFKNGLCVTTAEDCQISALTQFSFTQSRPLGANMAACYDNDVNEVT